MRNIILMNVKVKRGYREWLLEAKGLSITTIDQMLRAISLYEEIFPNEDYGLFNSERAMKFKEKLRNKIHKGKRISSSSIRTYLTHIKTFFEWLCTQPGFKSKISSSSLEYLRVTRKESRIAAQSNPREFPMIEYIIQLVKSIEIKSVVDRRDQALIAFAFLTGMRDAAIVSLPLKCLDEERMCVNQNPKLGVNTKFSKSFVSKIFRFDYELVEIVLSWIKYLKEGGFSSEDPVFPRSKSEMIENGYSYQEAVEVEPAYWTTTNSIRKIFQVRSANINLPYFPPHTFRHSAIFYALKSATTGEEIKAISQNFGHEDIMTTISIYANFTSDHLLEVLNRMESNKNAIPSEENFEKMIKEFLKKYLNQ